MSVFIFTGPTLTPAEGQAELDAVYLPPASQGDVYRAALHRPAAIGIIDGYFERLPAVWHKEILWAMSQGIHVYGSASMGALRAAELAQFGMAGVGWIFEAYRDGLLEDDDEVTVAHGLADFGYQAQSEAMVNIRRTLAAARATAVIGDETHDTLIGAAKDLYYPERSYPAILRQCAALGLPPEELERLRAWLPSGRVNQKREDALAMLRALRRHLEKDASPLRVSFTFEHTLWWDQAANYAGVVDPTAGEGDAALLLDTMLDELRLRAGAYRNALDGAALRVLSLREARRRGLAVSRDAVQEAADGFRTALGLTGTGDFEGWLAENHLTLARFGELMQEDALIGRTRIAIDGEVLAGLPDHLCATDQYDRLTARARAKQKTLEAHGLANPGLEDAGLTEDQLLAWYYRRLDRVVPSDSTRAAYEAGFGGPDALRLAVLREYCYLRLTEPEAIAPVLQGLLAW